jgi:hypothetical protein
LPRGDQKNGCCPTHHYQGMIGIITMLR